MKNIMEEVDGNKNIIDCTIYCPAYLIDLDKSDKENLFQLRELCCDEYYEYLDLVNIKIIKKLSKMLRKNILIDLILSCGSNGSIKAFEYLIKKFNIIIGNDFIFDFESIKNILSYNQYDFNKYNLIIIHDKYIKYWKNEFKKYIINNYDLDKQRLIILVKDLIWNKNLELVKEIYSKLNVSSDNIKLLFEKLKMQLFNSCFQNQHKILKFLIGIFCNCIDDKIINDMMTNIFEYRYVKKYTTQNRIIMLDFIFDNFSNKIEGNLINNSLKQCLDLELFEWIDKKKISINDKVWKNILSHLFANYRLENLFDVFYYVVKKIMKFKSKIDWNDYYFNYKYTYDNKLIKYLIDIGEIHIDLNDYSSNSNYYEYYQTKFIFEERKKYIEYYNSIYQKKLMVKNKLNKQITI